MQSIVCRRNLTEHWQTDLEFCRQNDQQNLYKKAESGEIENFPGIDFDHKMPVRSDLIFSSVDKRQQFKKPPIDFIVIGGFLYKSFSKDVIQKMIHEGA